MDNNTEPQNICEQRQRVHYDFTRKHFPDFTRNLSRWNAKGVYTPLKVPSEAIILRITNYADKHSLDALGKVMYIN